MSGTCLISFDRNRYSVSAKAVWRTVQVRAYATRIVVRLGGEVLADHPQFFGRDRTIYDPWHYLPVLVPNPAPCVTAHRSRTGNCRLRCHDCGASSALAMMPTGVRASACSGAQ